MVKTFPVTKLKYSIPKKGVYVAKRDEGTKVAECGISLKDISLSGLIPGKNISQDQLDRSKKVRIWLENGFRFLNRHSPICVDLAKDAELKVEFLENHSSLMNAKSTSVIQCDIDVAEDLDDPGIEILYSLGILYIFSSIKGMDEKVALDNVITFYENLRDDDKKALLKILSHPQIDSGKIFMRFLQNSAGKSRNEKERLIAWLRCRVMIDLPYNDANIIKALKEEKDLATLRIKIYNEINDTYVQPVDTENARRIADMCMEKGMRIVAGRFSRALYIDVMLMANSRVIDVNQIKEGIFNLEKLIKSSSLNFEGLPFRDKLPRDFSRIRGEIQMILNIAGEKSVSLAQIQGTISKLKKALREFETYCLERLDTGSLASDAKIISIIANCRKEIRDKVEAVFQEISNLEVNCFSLPKKEPVFLIFLQRIHPLDAINMGVLNQLEDPFFGEDEEVHELIRGCGHIMYTTANLRGWLRKCDDWIEALPAYAEYEIIPKNGSYNITTFVWRVILEEMYKQHAEDWAINIEEVMDLEHIALAREILAKNKGINLNTEREIIDFIKQEALEKETANLANCIESIYLDKCHYVSYLMEKQGISRLEALKQIINDNNLIPKELKESPRPQELEKLATKPRRNLPNVHVLTTLGPGETENVENWLEESMALFNVSRYYKLEDTDVQKRLCDYQKRIYNLGEKILVELELEGELYNIMQAEGLAGREEGVLRLIQRYPEVAAKVSELAVLKGYEEKQVNKTIDPQDTREPQMVIEYISLHPENDRDKINRLHDARETIVKSLNLRDEVRNYLRDHQPDRLGKITARREVILEKGLIGELDNPKFRYESHGPLKKYNLLYTPSRVDLGIDEVESVKNVPKWIGGRDREAANAGKSLYGLYNLAGPTAMPATKFAEFLKVGENFFSRGGVFYLSMTAGANLDALKIGDFEFFRDQWNMRGDRIVLPGGETYGGFCVPKEFTLLYAIILAATDPKSTRDVLNSFGVPEELHSTILDDLREVLKMRPKFDSMLDWERKANEIFTNRLAGRVNLSRLPRLATTMESKGIIAPEDEEDMVMGYRYAKWANKKAQGLEEINRSGPFLKVHLIHKLIKEARKKNPNIVPDNKIIGVMGAPYKEGGRKDGKEVPISDVRFGAGARKLEIYAGTAEKHLFKHIDPEGRTLLREMFQSFQTPADIRIVGTCTASDILNHVPGSGLEEISETVNNALLEAGLSQNTIDANCKIYGGDLERWADIKEMPDSQRKTFIDKIGSAIHLLVLSRRGVFRKYEDALQGVDFVDLGIPDPELLDLVDDLPKFLAIMRSGRPNSALVFADGTSGARRRTFSFRYASSKRKVKELFALDDNAIYGSMGLGEDTVLSWRQEMIKERQYAQELLDAIAGGQHAEAEKIYNRIVEYIRHEGKAEEAAQDEIMARKLKVPFEDYRYISHCFGKIKLGAPLEQIDFSDWVILGGMYILNGKYSQDEIKNVKSLFKITDKDESMVDHIVKRFVRPRYEQEIQSELYREVDTGIAGSLKAAEEKVGRLQKWETRRKETRRVAGLSRRKSAYSTLDGYSILDIEKIYAEAMIILGNGKEKISPEAFGKFLAYARAAFIAVGTNLEIHPINRIFTTAELDDEAYMALANNLAQLAVKDNKVLDKIAIAMEMLDIALAIEKTMNVESPEEMTIALARFYDITLNNHIFDYIPYHYHKQRGNGFEGLTREEKLQLAEKHHRWLYTYTRNCMVNETEIKDLGPEYQDAWLGDADKDIMGLGVNVQDKIERFWFSYVRLRDAIVLRHEGFPFPEIFTNVDSDAISCKTRSNVVIVYPHGNTTVPVALEQGPKLAKEGINLMLCAFPSIEHDAKRNYLRVSDAFMYVGEEDYKKLKDVAESLGNPSSANNKGALIAVKFKEPITAHGIFFHFTHPLRPYIGSVRAPLIQPLIWEAATHLKCRLPDMLKGSGTRTADQINWYRRQTASMSEDEAKKQIREMLYKFAENHYQLIAKPEKESGGRMAKILPVKYGGKILEENVAELANVVYNISRVDNVAIQDVLPSHVRRLYSREFLNDMVDRFARIGVPVLLDREPKTQLYSYFRQVVALGKNGYEITHHITVISTRGIANVGQGGILYEYRDEIINPKYREDMRREITRSALNSLESQRKYIRTHWREILEEYLEIHPEFVGKVKMEEPGEDLTGFSDADIPYEMGDYMPVFLVDERDNLMRIFHNKTEEMIPLFHEDGTPTDVQIYDEKGKPIPRIDENGSPIQIPMFDETGKRIPRFDEDGNPISTLVVYKIEPNPGAGLWRPHNDQLPPERKGEGVFNIFRCLGERAKVYRERI